jgi:predicted Fe-Mo cluster-binding NifX family protein
MKIALPLLNEKELAIDFTHSNFIGIYDVNNNELQILNNQSLEKKLKAMELFKNMINDGLAFTISPFYSYMSLRVFKEIRIKTLKAQGISLNDNIRSFKESMLLPFNIDESLLYGECAKDCTGCATDCSNN